MNYILKSAIILGLLYTTISCKKTNISPTQSAFNSFDRQGMLSNIGNNIIVPSYAAFALSSDSLYTATQQFIAAPDSAKLTTLQQQWLQTNLRWKSCELFNFGPALTGLYAANIQSYPFIISSTGYTDPADIESAVGNTPTAFDSTFVPKQNVSARGISAVEYMLYDPVNGNSAVLSKYTSSGTSTTQRLNYLKGITQDIQTNANSLLKAWQPSGGNYIQTFIYADDGNDINSSISFLVNQMVTFTDYTKNYKIGRPVGIRINASPGSPLPTYVETYYSSHALQCLTANCKSIDNTFFGVGNNGVKGSGFSDLLNAVNSQYSGEPLSVAVRKQLDTMYSEINKINMPLEKAVLNDASAVNTLYSSSKLLLVFFKLDMVGSLGVVLTTSDNDGD